MPKVLEAKLKKEYPNNPSAVYGTLNKLGFMKGSKETPKGKALDKNKGKLDLVSHHMSEGQMAHEGIKPGTIRNYKE